jgi:AhpC/TSA antioxidant enzyme
MPCLNLLSQLREAHPEITSLGADVLAVATGADYQARKLMAEGLPFPALVDPHKQLYRALGIERINWDQWFRPSTWRRYLRSIGQARQGRLTGDILQAPGVAILEPPGIVRWLHRGQTLGDYPTLSEILDVLRASVGR